MKKITLASCLLFVIALFVSSRWATAVVSAQPPLIGLSTQAPILGRSFLSTNGGATFTRRNHLNFRFSLVASQVPAVP